jgi:membrane-bound lytic murein transglycosylase A
MAPVEARYRKLVDMDTFAVSTRIRSAQAYLIALALTVSACAPALRAPGPAFRRIAPPPPFADDAERASLAAAVSQSARYFARLPPERPIAFGTVTRTAAEMRSAMESLASFLATAVSGHEIAAEIGRRFEVYRATPKEPVSFTGYYLPALAARATRDGRFRVPVLGRPPDLVTVPLGDLGAPCGCREQVTGRLAAGGGSLAPYFTRAEIENGAVKSAPSLAWVEDPVGLFFVQVQGSGVLLYPDGTRRTIGFAASNGRPYTSIGRVLVDRGELTLEQASMDSIRRWVVAHPREESSLLQTNARYVFFRMLEGPPLGSLGVPVTPGRTIATDPAIYPPGVLAYISIPAATPGAALSRFVLNQDAGAAIRGPSRVDVYFGDAPGAADIAGRLRALGEIDFLVPREALGH